MVKMYDLKQVFETNGYTNVITYINSGNVLFECEEKDTRKIVSSLEKVISKRFNYEAHLFVCSYQDLEEIASHVPADWKKANDLRCYISFVMQPFLVDDVIKEVEIKEGIDSIKKGKHVIYMSTKMSGLTKSNFTKLIAKKVYKQLTMRNYTTVKKLLAL